MAIQRSVSWASQGRVDIPDMRSVESAVRNDFDQLIQGFVTGSTNSYVIRGFNLLMAGAIGGAASGLSMYVDSAAVLHTTSSQSGTVLQVASGTAPQQLNSATNTIVDGAFAPSAINYVSIEFERYVDDTTSAQIYLWDPSSKSEITKNAPRAIVLRYRIKITTATPAANFLPIAIVVTDSSANVTSVSDIRPMINRLGKGGVSANPFSQYSWPQGRNENPSTSTSNSVDPFSGGDKAIANLKDWMDAVATSVQEIKGTTYWYSQSSSGSLASMRQDLGNTVVTGKGYISHGALPNGATTLPGQINWDQDINIRVIGSALTYKLNANASSTDISLSDDQVAYITLIRGIQVIPNLIFTNSLAQVTSVGAISWTGSLVAGDYLKLASDTDAGYYQILSVDSLTQVTLTTPYTGISTGIAGAKGKYSFGSYSTSPLPSTNRHVYISTRATMPEGENVFWLFLRTDNGGSTPRVYIRFMGTEIESGETEEISDSKSQDTLKYIGAAHESSYSPMYVSALNPGSIPQITTITVGSASTVASNQYFFIDSSGDSRRYAVWINKNGTGLQPVVPFATAYAEWTVTTGDSATVVAASLASALNTVPAGDFKAVAGVGSVVITNSSAGTCSAAANFNVGAPFAIVTNQSGTGTGNFVVHDGDNLTLAIKELDDAIGNLNSLLDSPSYDEAIDIVSSGQVPPHSLNGPISPGTILNIPNNSREGNLPQKYTVGKGGFELYLNGQYLRLGVDWLEVGAAGVASSQVQIVNSLSIGDALQLRMDATGGSGSGSGGVGPAGPPGPQGPIGHDALGGPIAVSTKNSSYTVLLADNVLRANCATGPITFSLPTAASAVGHAFYLKKVDATVNMLTILAAGSETIDGVNSLTTVVQYEAFTLVSNGSSWDIL